MVPFCYTVALMDVKKAEALEFWLRAVQNKTPQYDA
jgi:hypothetical protein